MTKEARVVFIIDGFNLYHSVRKAGEELQKTTKWLNIRSLCESYLYIIGKQFQTWASLKEIYYFSALAYHIQGKRPRAVDRHKALLECLRDTGIIVELNRFKPKDIYCPKCRNRFTRYEEKETDVSIAVKAIEIVVKDKADIITLVTGDTDLAPCVRFIKSNYPRKKVVFAFPYRRKNKELKQIGDFSFYIDKNHYVRHQFPDPYTLCDGRKIFKPKGW